MAPARRFSLPVFQGVWDGRVCAALKASDRMFDDGYRGALDPMRWPADESATTAFGSTNSFTGM